MVRVFFYFLVSMIVFFSGSAQAADGKSVVEKGKCASCHKMKGPAVTTIAEIMKRKAPDLFYAGSKFKKEWLVQFLQSPTQIRPGGTVYANHIKANADGQDVISGLVKCASKLSAGDAKSAADYLMTLKDADMKNGVFKKAKVKKARARRVMMKAEACNACHSFPKKGGGISCPTFEGIGSRLNPDWMYSFINHPQKWDPKIWMAKRDLDDATLQLMVNFLSSMK